jgi:aspartyl-tRNA(Asn)/glutamyl-tRNA(Gln) amidotransferase subunit C
MKVDKELIQHVAEVARLNLTDEEIEKFVKDFKEILDTFSTIDKCDTKGARPSFQPVELKNQLREDLVEDSLEQKDALKNTEHKKDGYFKGPRAV